MQIASHLPDIVSLISQHPVVSVIAPTGSGKSVAVPSAIAAVGARVFVTVPTRTAAISLATYQKTLQRAANPGADVEKLVGYAAESQVHYGPSTMIAYVTGGHARRKMLSYFTNGIPRPIDFCDVLMVDEVHAGSLDNTVIISLWMYAASLGVQVPRLLVASATPVPMTIEPVPVVYTVDLAAFPIEYRYLAKDIDIDDHSGALYTEAAKLAAKVHTTTPIDSGHILIFAPGSSDVEKIMETLSKLLEKEIAAGTVDIIPAFGALKPEDIALIYKETGNTMRKIVIATNIAEMSITIPDIGHVIDTLTEKRAETSQSGGFRLTTRYIAKDSAKQRAGRTGRTRPGVCYRMATLERFESLEQHRPSEIQRVPIFETIMELLAVGLHPQNIIKDLDAKRIGSTIQLLQRIGMITDDNGTITVTDSGYFAPKFHISVRNAAFLWQWIQAGYPIFPGIVVACLIDSYGPSYFWVPRRKANTPVDEHNDMVKKYKEKYFKKYLGYNDLETSLNMWHDLVGTLGGIAMQPKKLLVWSQANSINNKKVKEMLTIVEQSVKAAVRLGYDVQVGPFTTAGVMTAARPLLLSVYSDMTLINKRDINYFSPITKEDYRLDTRDTINGFVANPPIGVIALVTAEIKTQTGAFRVIGFAVDTDKDGLGRPIVQRNRPAPRAANQTIVRTKGTRPERAVRAQQAPDTNITDALDLLATLNVTAPAADITETLKLLEGLNIGNAPVNPDQPPLRIEEAVCGAKTFKVIQEHYLEAGTKQRGIEFFRRLKEQGFTEVVTYGTPYGYGQVATAWSCYKVGLLCSLFLEEVPGTLTAISQEAQSYGAQIMLMPSGTRNAVKREYALAYAAESPQRKFVQLGLDDEQFIQDLANGIASVAGDLKPATIWVAGGSVVLTRALAKVFPDTFFNIVQVGRDIWPELLVGIKHKIYVSQQPFPEDTRNPPPYPSLGNYDAKVWQFACQNGTTGDYIWNVK